MNAMLSPEQIEARRNKLTASTIKTLMVGTEAEVRNLWRFYIDDPSYVEPDLSDVWPVQLGSVTESLNLDWYERKWGAVGQRGDVVSGGPFPWMAATLDGWDIQRGCPIECKHCGGHQTLATIIDRYQPQMHWQMLCTGAKTCAISVIFDAREPVVEYIDFNETYAVELLRRASVFWQCVTNLQPPSEFPPPLPPPPPPGKVYDMLGSNEWAAHAKTFSATKVSHTIHENAKKAIKILVPEDAKKCFGYGIQVTRAKNGALTIRPEKDDEE